MFSVSSVQSVTLHLFLTLSGLLQTNSLWLYSQQTAEFQVRHSSWVVLLSPLVSDKALVRASDIALQTCSNFADYSLQLAEVSLFVPFLFLFLVNSMVKKKSVPRRWGSSAATAPAAALAFPVPVAPQTPRLPSNPPPSLPSYVNTAYEHGRPAGLTAPTWVPLHGAWILQTPTASPAQWFGSGGAALPGVPRRSMRRAPRLTPAGVHWEWTWDPPGPSVPVPEEWVIPPRHGPPALPQEESLLEVEDVDVIVEVEGISPDSSSAQPTPPSSPRCSPSTSPPTTTSSPTHT